MKKYALLFGAIALIAGNSCTQKIDYEMEKEAIMKVVQTESENARDGNYEGLISCYIQDEFNTRLNMESGNFSIIKGWDKLLPYFELFKSSMEGSGYSGVTISKENAIVKVIGNTAWLICDNIWKGTYEGKEVKSDGIQITFLEKADGKWKISFAAWIDKPEPEVVSETPEKAE